MKSNFDHFYFFFEVQIRSFLLFSCTDHILLFPIPLLLLKKSLSSVTTGVVKDKMKKPISKASENPKPTAKPKAVSKINHQTPVNPDMYFIDCFANLWEIYDKNCGENTFAINSVIVNDENYFLSYDSHNKSKFESLIIIDPI